MNRSQKLIIGFLIIGISATLLYIILTFGTFGSVGSDSDDSSFPFFIFLPSWVAIFIPIIIHQRQEEKRERENLEKRYEES